MIIPALIAILSFILGWRLAREKYTEEIITLRSVLWQERRNAMIAGRDRD